jgi:hypothetical protein
MAVTGCFAKDASVFMDDTSLIQDYLRRRIDGFPY